jgi:hypothetical protein
MSVRVGQGAGMDRNDIAVIVKRGRLYARHDIVVKSAARPFLADDFRAFRAELSRTDRPSVHALLLAPDLVCAHRELLDRCPHRKFCGYRIAFSYQVDDALMAVQIGFPRLGRLVMLHDPD